MKWRSHIQIAERVGTISGLSKEEKRELVEGSIAPDRWKDHSRHHNHKYLDIVIVERIEKCRKLFLNRSPIRFFEMGVVLHYIADRLLPEASYLQHVDIEEELAKISDASKKAIPCVKDPRILAREATEAIADLDIEERVKTLLMDHHLVKGRRNALTLSLADVPKQTRYMTLMDIADRISSGVASSVMSGDPPGDILRTEFQLAGEAISQAILGFKRYSIPMFVAPFLFLACGRAGWAACFGALAVSSWGLWPVVLMISNRGNRVSNYLVSCDRAKTLFVFFLLGGAAILSVAFLLDSRFFLPAATLLFIALAHLFLPRVAVSAEVKSEIDWYDWN
jgi:hypothetical protein